MQLWRYSGIALLATGVIHTAAAIAFFANVYLEIINDGVINAVEDGASRELAFWFLILGVFIILFGQVLHYYIKKERRPAPLSFGYSLLALSIFGCFAIPLSGFWLFLPQALIIIVANVKARAA
jgi:hypothetical protein